MSDDWAEFGVFEVADGVHRVPLPLPGDGLRAVNVYVLAGGDGFSLIDSGWAVPEARELLGRALAELGGSPADIRRFLVTHIHRDHYTQAVALRRDFGTPVSLGAGEQPSLRVLDDHREPFSAQLTHLRRLGADTLAATIAAAVAAGGGDERIPIEPPDDWLEPGRLELDGVRTLEVVETPGHTRGHVIFHDLNGRILFAGDHVLPAITPSIGFEPALSPDPLGAFLGSLATVRARPDALLLPAHGPVGPSVHARVDQLIDHHRIRLEQTEAAVKAGASTGWEVAGRLRWTRRDRERDELDVFNRMLAVSETGAHLELLVAQGRLVPAVEDNVLRYRPA